MTAQDTTNQERKPGEIKITLDRYQSMLLEYGATLMIARGLMKCHLRWAYMGEEWHEKVTHPIDIMEACGMIDSEEAESLWREKEESR